MGKGLIASACAAVSVALLAGCGGGGKPRPDLVFVSTRDGVYALWAMNADGSRQSRLAGKGETNASTPQGLFFQTDPSWSPDRRRIVFASEHAGKFDLYVIRADGTGTTRLTSTSSEDTHPTWSPDGKRIAFVRGNFIEVMSADGRLVRRLTDDLAAESDPAWSPNGRWIAYVRKAQGTDIKEVSLLHPDGSGRRQLTHLDAVALAPTWSPDSSQIAFSSNSSSTNYHIYEIRLDGKGLRLMTQLTTDDVDPAWSPDGKKIAFSRDGAIWTVDATGGHERRLTNPKNNDSSPTWKPGAKS